MTGRQDEPQTAADVEDELRSTRADLDETLREIEIRLTPRHLAQETRHYAAEKVAAARAVARRHPVLTLLGAMAVGYLLVVATSERERQRAYARLWPAR